MRNLTLTLVASTFALAGCVDGKLTEDGKATARLAVGAAQILYGSLSPSVQDRHVDGFRQLDALLAGAPVPASRMTLAEACAQARGVVSVDYPIAANGLVDEACG